MNIYSYLTKAGATHTFFFPNRFDPDSNGFAWQLLFLDEEVGENMTMILAGM